MSEWKPIETAPKDGTQVLLYFRHGGYAVGSLGDDVPAALRRLEHKHLYERFGVWPNADFMPTHWQPLVPPND